MRRLIFLLCLASSLFAQAPQTVPVTIVYNITSPTQVFDNRSIQRQCNNVTYSVVSGTGTWSVQLEYADGSNTGPWTSFGSGGIVTSSAPLSHGAGFAYHDFYRLNTTAGSTNVTLSCEKDFALAGTGGGGGGGGTPGGNPGDFQVNVGGTSFGGVTPPIGISYGGTGVGSISYSCTNGITCTGIWPNITYTLTTGPTVYAGTPAQEVPTGTVNGSNATFTLSQTPNGSTLQLYRNGVFQKPTVDYTLSTATITFQSGAIPQTGDLLYASYQYGSGGGGGGGNATQINGASVPPSAVALTNTSSQIVDGTAAVKNVGNKAVLRDDQNALDNGNGTSNGIASAITACGTSTPCAVLAPPSYGQSEAVPGSSETNWYDGTPPSAATQSANITVHDQRWGDDMMVTLNCFGYNISGNHICNIPQYDYIVNPANLRVFDNIGTQVSVLNAMDGGVNQGGAGVVATNKINWSTDNATLNSWTAGQREASGGTANCYGLGDCLAGSYSIHSWVGPNADSDEGSEGQDIELFGPSDEPTFTISGYSSNIMTVSSWTYGQGHQGLGRYAIRENAGTVTGTVSSISSPGTGPTVVTVTGTTLSASTIVGTTGAFSPNATKAGISYTSTITPTLTTGSLSGATTSTQFCIADPDGGIEAVYPTAVTSTQITAVFRKPHASTSIIASGGLSCSHLLSLTYENATSSQTHLLSGTVIQAISGTIHNAIPIIYTTSTQAHLFYATNGQWDTWQALWDSANAGFTIYPGAQVVSVQSSGTVGNQITLEPNNAGFTASDTVGIPPYFSKSFSPGHKLDENYWPNSSFNSGGFGYQTNHPMGVSDVMMGFSNNTDPSLYSNQILIPPQGINLDGYVQSGLNLQYAPDYWVFSIGGASPGLIDAYPIKLFQIANQNSTATPSPTGSPDDMYYDPYGSTEYWQWTTGARAGATYSMYIDHFDINGAAMTMEEFAGGTQTGISVNGYAIGIGMTQPLYWGLGVACTSPCTTQYNVIAAANSGLQDYISYNPSSATYGITANSNAVQYEFGPTTMTTPWLYNKQGLDSGSSQSYVSAENFVFGGVALINTQPTCNSTYVGYFAPAYYGQQSSTLEYCTNRNGSYEWVNLNTGIETFAYASTLAFSGVIPTSEVTSLTGNVSSWTLAAGPIGQTKTLTWCQDTTGGRTVAAAPSNVKGFVTPGTTANTCSSQTFIELLIPNEWQAINQGIQNVPI